MKPSRHFIAFATAICLGVLMFLVSVAAHATTLTARQGDDWVMLYESPCLFDSVKKQLDPGVVGEFHTATAMFQGHLYEACWHMTGGAAYLVYEDGDQGIIPAADLKPALEV